MLQEGDFGGRKAPYAPISALRDFLVRMRNVSVPAHVDRRFIQKQNIASSNEWALLSALKFLGVVDSHGIPTHAYRLLQTTDSFQETLSHLVRTAYGPLFESGGSSMSSEDLENYFRVTSSPSQAKNAARFFRGVCALAGIQLNAMETEPGVFEPAHTSGPGVGPGAEAADDAGIQAGSALATILSIKAELLAKLPSPRSEWSAGEYEAICAHFVQMLDSLDRSLPAEAD